MLGSRGLERASELNSGLAWMEESQTISLGGSSRQPRDMKWDLQEHLCQRLRNIIIVEPLAVQFGREGLEVAYRAEKHRSIFQRSANDHHPNPNFMALLIIRQSLHPRPDPLVSTAWLVG